MSPWDQRIARAEELGVAPRCSAAEVLRFYTYVARVQQHTYETLPVALLAAEGPPVERLMARANLDLLSPRLLDLLRMACTRGTEPLARRAAEIADSSAERMTAVLAAFWQPQQDALDRFFARAVLQAAAERMAETFELPTGYRGQVCPFCASEPLLSALRPENLGAKRSLLCSLCATEWDFPRARCPVCGEERNDRLSIYSVETPNHVRIDACETCKVYVKTIDLSQLGTAVPIVDDIATMSLSLWAAEHRYRRLAPNLFESRTA